MAGKKDIEAGRAIVRLMMKDSAFVKGLRSASKRLKNFGTGVAKLGAGITAVGASIVAPLLGAVNHFSAVGDSIDKMAARTGIGAQALSEIAFAAGQSGTSIDDVERSVARMQKTIGSGTAKPLEDMGLSLKELQKLSPEDQFQTIADRLSEIEDPTKRAALAMNIFGRSGTKILPLLKDLRAGRAEAQELGIGITEEDSKQAAAVNDAIGRIKAQLSAIVFQAGSALAPTILEIADVGKRVLKTFIDWVKENKQLIVTVFKIGAGIMAVGAAVSAIGLGIIGVGAVLGGLATTLAAMGSVLGVVLSPLGLVVGALVAGVAAWARFTASGQAAVAGVRSLLDGLLTTFHTTFGGIFDAIATGNLALAGQIAMAGLQVAMLQGTAAIVQAVSSIFGTAWGALASQVLTGDFSSAWETVLANISSMWAGFSEGLVAVFTTVGRAITDIWQKVVGFVTDKILWVASKVGWLSKLVLGVDLKQVLDDEKKLDAQLGLGPSRGLEGVQQDARGQIGGQADAFRDRLDSMDRGAQQRTRDATGAQREATAGATLDFSDAIADAEAGLSKLAEQAAAARDRQREEQAAREEERQTDFDGIPDAAAMKQQSIITFSAAALAAQGQGAGGPLEEQKKTNQILDKQNTKLDKLIVAVEGGLA